MPEGNKVSFDTAYNQLMLRWEDPHMSGAVTTDKGGITKYGLSEGAHPSLNIRELTPARAKEIAHQEYWLQPKWDIYLLDLKSQCLANKLFQFGFSLGTGTVIQIANMCLHISGVLNEIPKLGDPLRVSPLEFTAGLDLLNMLAAAQLSRYIVDYHLLSRVPHSLLDRALCIE